MKQYIFIFHGGWPQPQFVEENAKKWGQWMTSFAQATHSNGQRFLPDGKIVSGSGSIVADLIPDSDTMGAFVIVDAKSYEQAVALTKSCPVFDHGGTVEVRELQPS